MNWNGNSLADCNERLLAIEVEAIECTAGWRSFWRKCRAEVREICDTEGRDFDEVRDGLLQAWRQSVKTIPVGGATVSVETLGRSSPPRVPHRRHTTRPRFAPSDARPKGVADGSETGAGDSVSACLGYEGDRVDGRKVKQAGSLRRKPKKCR